LCLIEVTTSIAAPSLQIPLALPATTRVFLEDRRELGQRL
jgi:hypothetical protein